MGGGSGVCDDGKRKMMTTGTLGEMERTETMEEEGQKQLQWKSQNCGLRDEERKERVHPDPPGFG